MIHLRTRNKKKIAGLVGYKDLYIESELQSGEKTLCFSYPKKAPYYKDIVEECYITTKENEYVIKERNVQDEYTEFKCILNLEDIEGKPFFKFESKEQPIDKALALALAGTGWIVGNCDLKKKRTVRMANCSSLEIIKEIKKIYRCDIVFNTLTKTIDVFEHLGEDKGVYFIDSLNLKSLGIQGNSYEYFTRLIPVGKDDLKITDINDKKEYVENYQYSNKVKTAYWVDDRYTIKENLKEDAIAKLNEISKPFRSYSAAVFNLAKLNKKYKNILDYKLGDTITLISKEDRFKDKQRIVKIIEFPDEHEKDSVELANTTLCFEDIQTQFQEAADTVENITTDNGTVKGSTIDGIETKQIKDFHQEVVSATNIKAINAQIVNLEAHNVTISGQLAAVNAQIGNLAANVATIDKLTVTHTAQINNLVATSATITDLHAINALINVLEANVGRIDTLVNGNLSSENIQAGGITSDKLTIENGFIKNAMISDLDVSKINAGDISTNKFKIKSDDGGIEIVGATQQFKDKNNKVRIQMGKDAKGDFNFIIRGEDGSTTLIDHTGVKEKAIADDLIKSNMISSNSVGEKQIDYSSFSEGFNKDTNTHTLKATKIKLNNQNQTLDVAFNQLKTQTDENKTKTESNSTTIR
ncbi:phage tail protein, partial [Paraclostridium sordellii]|uniref:phage tail protein n=2 Tax=Paraclostridium sordellii TaxID=1505 RepID=UPI0022E5D398